MKKLTLLFAFAGLSFFASAQSTTSATTSTSIYKAFKVDFDFGYATPSTGTAKAGVNFAFEPHYRLSDDFALGLRLEGAGFLYQTGGSSGSTSASVLFSYCLTGDYYLSNSGFRPFIGAGVGFFQQQTVNGNSSSGSNSVTLIPGSTNFGFFPRVGFEAGHLRLSASYDIVGNNSSYAAFTIGFFFGGGKK